jgi:hypothetical protein
LSQGFFNASITGQPPLLASFVAHARKLLGRYQRPLFMRSRRVKLGQVEEDVLDGPPAPTGEPSPFPEGEEPRLDNADVLLPRVR